MRQAIAQEHNISNQVKFFNKLPRTEALEALGKCHALVHPSLHDSGSWVCIEAMAAGKPVICLDLGGPGTQVTKASGYKVAATNPKQVTTQLAIAMATLASDAKLRAQMGQVGQQIVYEKFNWDQKILSQIQLYEKVLGRSRTPAAVHR